MRGSNLNPSALILFGGRDGVSNRMTQAVCERLKGNNPCKYNNKKLKELEIYLNLPPGLLNNIKQGQKKVDIDLFEKLEGPLDLPSICDILDKPDFKTAESSPREWKKEQRKSPMYLVAHSGGQVGKKIPKRPIKLETYVTLRAIGELHRTNQKQGR